MKTTILKNTIEDIKKAGDIIKNGGLVAFPTETVYGLGANGLDEKAVRKIYEAKGRPKDNPMILHVSKKEDIYKIAKDINDDAKRLIEKFWPGPLTIVVNRNNKIPNITTGGLNTVGVRMPSDKTAIKLIEEAGVPIAAPSANISGKPSPTKAEHVIKDLFGKIDGIIEGEKSQVGIESTVVSTIGDKVVILRPGQITHQDIEATLGKKILLDPSLEKGINDNEIAPMSPGMKYKHYAPEAEMVIIDGEEDKVREEICKRKSILESQGKKVGVLLFDKEDHDTAAKNLFAELRKMDEESIDYIIAGAVKEDGVGYAIMNRMLKSSGYNIVYV